MPLFTRAALFTRVALSTCVTQKTKLLSVKCPVSSVPFAFRGGILPASTTAAI